MACESELKILLKVLADGTLTPQVVAQAGRAWLESSEGHESRELSKSGQLSFVKYLVERGVLSQEQVRTLETALNIRGEGFSLSEETLVISGNGLQAGSSTPQTIAATPQPFSTADPADRTKAAKEPAQAGPSLPGPERYFQFRSFRKGGPGQIWLAWDNALGREVVVKSLRPDLAEKPAMLSRFIREARITGQLEHPNIIPVYDLIGKGAHGANWAYSMRYLSGPTLAEAIDQYHQRLADGEAKPLDLVSLLDSFVLLCKAVAFAHSRQIIHRDLKGQNVVLGDFGEVVLLDWGLGKKIEDPDSEEDGIMEIFPESDREPLTLHGAINGTPAYMSLEVAKGEPATKSSDIYSLGAILYGILTGRAPYKGSHPLETLEMVKKEPPPSPRSLNRSISPALEAIALKAMRRTPAERYAAAENLADDVRRWLVDEPVSVYRDSLAVRAFRWARKRRTATVAFGVFLLSATVALAVGSALILSEQRETLKQKAEADANYKIARDLSLANIALMEKSEVFFTSSQELSQIRKGILDGTARAFRKFHHDDPRDIEMARAAMRVFRYAANVHQFDGEYDEARSLFESALGVFETKKLQENIDDQTLAFKAQILRDFSKVMDSTGKLKDAKKHLQEATSIYDKIREKQPKSLALQRGIGLANLELAGILMSLEEGEKPQELLEQSIKSYNELLDKSNNEDRHPYDVIFLGHGFNRLGAYHREKRRFGDALALHEKAMASVRPLLNGFRESSEPILNGVSRIDLLVMAANCSLDRTETWIAGGAKPPQEIRQHFTASIGQLSAIDKQFNPKRPVYTYFLIKALCQRGLWLDSLGEKAAANADFRQAKVLGDELALAFEKAPRQHFYRGLAVAALSKYENGETEKQQLKNSGLKFIKESRERSPDDRGLLQAENQLLERFFQTGQ